VSYSSAEYTELSKKAWIFSSWMIDNVQNINSDPSSSPYLKNARLDGESIVIRPWHDLFAQLTTWDYPRWIGSYLRDVPANDRLVVRHNQAYTSAYLTGWTSATSVVATRAAVSDWAFQITIDWTALDITWIDFTGNASMAIIATTIQTAIRAETSSTETVTRSTDHFIISSVDVTSSSAITVTTAWTAGTDISWVWGTTFMDCETAVGTVTALLTNKLVTLDTSATIVPINTAALIASDNNMQFVNVWDLIYCMNGSDNMCTLSDTTYTAVTSWFGTVSFSELWLNDLKFYWCNTSHVFVITIDAEATPDTFAWTIDGWGWAAWVAITWGYQVLSNWMTIKFTNTVGHTDTAAWTITTTPSAAPSFGVTFNSSMFISWVTSNPNVVYKSVWDVYGDFSNIGSDQFTFGEPMTWIATVSEAIFFFTKNTIAITNTADITDTAGIISYTNRKLAVTEWAYNHKCIVSTGNDVYYLSSSLSINKLARGENIYWFETLPVSDRPYSGISKLMATIDPDQSKAFAYFEPDTKLIKRHFMSLGWAVNDIVVVYDTNKNKFLHDTNVYYTDWVRFKWQNYTTSNTEAKVFLNEYGQDDEWSPIPFEYRTKEFFISEPTFKKIIRESRTLLDINELANCYQYIYTDGTLVDTKLVDSDNIPISSWGIATTTVGTSTIGTWWGTAVDDDYYEIDILRTKWNLNTKLKKVQRRWTEDTVAWKVRLKNVMPKIEIVTPYATNLTA